MDEFKRGVQIAYIPNHAEGDINHPSVEFGFITSIHKSGEMAFCRFWSEYEKHTLRTKSNSELVSFSNLVPHISALQDFVDAILEKLP